MVTLNVIQDVIVPFIVGIVIPFLTSWISARGVSDLWETMLNAALSAAASALVTLTFDGDWKTYLLSFAVAWIGAMRGHYTGLPAALYSNRVTGRHARLDDPGDTY